MHREPRLRMFCHCTICQRFNAAPYADIAIFRHEEVEMDSVSSIDFQRYKSPPAVDRGRCRSCGQPFVEYLKLPIGPAIAFVPSAVLEPYIVLPAPEFRLFYDKRIDDADDDLPRYSGFWRSQIAAVRAIYPALRR
ncbi:MAG: GFA family protein [Pseudomonadota bacterium]